MNDLVTQLRRLQHAANTLNYREFCSALEWDRDDYSRDKFHAFQALGRMHVFDDSTLTTLVNAYDTKVANFTARLIRDNRP